MWTRPRRRIVRHGRGLKSHPPAFASRRSTNLNLLYRLWRVDNDPAPDKAAQARFEPTRWSVVLASAQTQVPGAREALEELCRTYWQPLYAFARRFGQNHHQAQDTIQSFFLLLIESKSLSRADPLKGRFRSYLLASLQNHMANNVIHGNAAKRGGGAKQLSIDDQDVREAYDNCQVSPPLPAEAIFEREWAVAAVEAALAQLEKTFARRGKREVFTILKPFLTGDASTLSYEQAAEKLGQNVGTVRTGVSRLRHDFRISLRKEIAKTVESPDQIEEEMTHLRNVLSARTI